MDKYKFTKNWSGHFFNSWKIFFSNGGKHDYKYTDKIKNVLEVGCYEGRTSMWLCDNVLKSGTTFDMIDVFNQDSNVEGNLRHNISHHSDINFKIYKGYSQSILQKLYELGNKYDLIYVDASHQSDDTFVDGYYCHKMLNSDGLIIFDDYGWTFPKFKFDYQKPKSGIDFFFKMYGNQYYEFNNKYQKFGQKK